MVPPSIRSNLAGLRRRERLLTFLWGLTCWLAIVLILLLICGFIDWFIDRDRDTPIGVRHGLLTVQVFVAVLAGIWFVVWPQIRSLPDDLLALWVEEKIPHFEHRLISAVQLNRPGARLDGMSSELVAVVTREAEQEAQRVGFAQVADHRRLKWCAFVILPVVLLLALPFLLWPDVSFALLARQGLRDVEIPHSVYLTSVTPEVWPIGDTIPIRYRVTGEYDEDMEGTVAVTPSGQATDRYPLRYITKDDKGAVFGADVLPASSDVRYAARLADGRTKLPSELKLVPRPIVTENQAWIQLPVYCGRRPNGERYERPQGRGDVVGIPGSGVRVQVKIQKEIKNAWIEILGVDKAELPKSEDEAPPPEKVREKKKMALGEDRTSAHVSFELTESLTGYRVIVMDDYDFPNVPAPRRSLRLVPEEAPQVTLLRDTFGIGADYDLEGLPVLLGGKIRVPYACFGPYGLGKAQILYRVLKKVDSEKEPVEDEPWIKLALNEVVPDESAGVFDPKTGVFTNTRFDKQVPFHAVPSSNPDTILGRTLGGGRYFLETNGLIDTKGMRLQLKSGDQIEYCVEVFAAHREPASSVPVARSESRVSTVLDENQLTAWMRQVSKEDERVKQLEVKQKGIFERR